MYYFKFIIFLMGLLMLSSCHQSELPVINITTEEQISSDNKVNCQVSVSTMDDADKLSAEIKARGGFSAKFDKRSYYLELDEHIPLLGLPKEDDWILNANYIDKTFMRHKLSYDLFRLMNEQNVAPKCSYTKVTINEEQMGIYVLMQKVTANLVGLEKSNSEAALWKDPPIFRQVIDSTVTNVWGQKYPKFKKRPQDSLTEQLFSFLNTSTDEFFVEKVDSVFDTDNIIDWHLLLLLSNNSDGILKNFYLYKTSANQPFRIAIWDYDHSYGRDGDNELNMLERILDTNRSTLLKRLMQAEGSGYYKRLQSRYRELRATDVFSMTQWTNMIAANHSVIGRTVSANERLWPADGKGYYDDNKYNEEKELLLTYMQLRLEQLDTYFKN